LHIYETLQNIVVAFFNQSSYCPFFRQRENNLKGLHIFPDYSLDFRRKPRHLFLSCDITQKNPPKRRVLGGALKKSWVVRSRFSVLEETADMHKVDTMGCLRTSPLSFLFLAFDLPNKEKKPNKRKKNSNFLERGLVVQFLHLPRE